ncbi:hypothetical protein BC629DRAFT_1587772 [Irpex lacteus]|nr:hypothetical protein BC629DRAFT_1587772 [Irpex lacteus]
MDHKADDKDSPSLNEALLRERTYHQNNAGRRGTEQSAQEITKLKDENDRLRKQRNEERREVDRLNRVIEDQDDELEYLEHKCEQLRRELLAHGRPRSAQGTCERIEKLPQEKLMDVIIAREVERDHANLTNNEARDNIERNAKATRPLEDRLEPLGANASANDRSTTMNAPATSSNTDGDVRMMPTPTTMPLAQRLIPTGPRHGPARNEHQYRQQPRYARPLLTSTPDSPAHLPVAEMWRRLVPDRDEMGEPIIIDGTQTGYRVIHGNPVDVSLELPAEKPTEDMINPITGEPWTAQGIREYPNGYPGYPAHWPYGRMSEAERRGAPVGTGARPGRTGPDRAPVPIVDSLLLSRLDQSASKLSHLPEAPRWSKDPWAFPRTMTELEDLRRVAHEPCNITALDFWHRYAASCARIPKGSRTDVQHEAARISVPRPTWAPLRRLTSKEYAQRKRARTQEEIGDAMTIEPIASMSSQMHVTDTPTDTPVEPASSSNAHMLFAGTTHINAWARYLEHNPDIVIPGVTRSSTGAVEDFLALRGALRVSRLGPESTDGILTRQFLEHVATFLQEPLHEIHAAQFLESRIFVGDLSFDSVREYLYEIQGRLVEFIDQDTVGADFDAVAHWLNQVKAGPSTAQEEPADGTAMAEEN